MTVTPEHLQLLSDKKLLEAAETVPETDQDRALVRAARYELRRRQCDVPVSDRYSSRSAAVTA